MRGQNLIQRVHDGAWIPKSEDNGDYRRYLRFIENGNTPAILDYRTDEGRQAAKDHEVKVAAYFKQRMDAHNEARERANEMLRSEANG